MSDSQSLQVQAGDKVVVSVAAEPMTRGTVLGSSHDKAGSEDRRCLVLGIGEVLLGWSSASPLSIDRTACAFRANCLQAASPIPPVLVGVAESPAAGSSPA